LLTRGHLGADLRTDSHAARRNAAGEISSRYLLPQAAVLDLVPAIEVLGHAQPRSDLLYHPYQIWDRPADA
jgi:hypothetical protein